MVIERPYLVKLADVPSFPKHLGKQLLILFYGLGLFSKPLFWESPLFWSSTIPSPILVVCRSAKETPCIGPRYQVVPPHHPSAASTVADAIPVYIVVCVFPTTGYYGEKAKLHVDQIFCAFGMSYYFDHTSSKEQGINLCRIFGATRLNSLRRHPHDFDRPDTNDEYSTSGLTSPQSHTQYHKDGCVSALVSWTFLFSRITVHLPNRLLVRSILIFMVETVATSPACFIFFQRVKFLALWTVSFCALCVLLARVIGFFGF